MINKSMKCPYCGKDMIDDYFIMDIKRIKDSWLHYSLPIVLCLECYESLRFAGNKPFHKEDL